MIGIFIFLFLMLIFGEIFGDKKNIHVEHASHYLLEEE